jgi:multiple sugar transport system permease protein
MSLTEVAPAPPITREQRAAQTRLRWARALLYVVIAILLVPFVFPLWWMITSSLKTTAEVFAFPPALWPQEPQWENYARVFELQPFAQQYWNSVYIAVLVTAGVLLVSSMAGYAFARIRFRGANLLFLILIAGLLIPREVIIIPLFQMFQQVGVADSHLPLILIPLFGAQSVFGTFIMRQFFIGLPKELEEAGRIDGLGRFGVFFRVAMPLAKPAVAALTIIIFLQTWDMFLEPLVFLSTPSQFTLPVALTHFSDAYGGPIWNVQLAATTMMTLPVLFVYVMAQRHFIRGIAQTGLKG